MSNGSVYVGRATGSIFAGRARPSAMMGVTPNGGAVSYGMPTSPVVWPRMAGICQPIQQCCCKGPVNIAPGEIMSLMLNWAGWIDSLNGYAIDSIASAHLVDPADNMQPADPDVIKIVSGKQGDPDPPDNSDVAGLISLAPPYGTQVLIECAPDARIGCQFKLDICLVAHDCDGRRIRQCDCVVLTVAEC